MKDIEMRESANPVSPVIASVGTTATVIPFADHVLVTVCGEIDETFTEVGASVIERVGREDRPVHVDLSDVTFFCAAGAAWLLRLYAAARGDVHVVAMSTPVRGVLDLCGVPARSTTHR